MDDSRFEEFFDLTYERAQRVARRVGLDAFEAEDAAMEALTRAYMRWRRICDLPWKEAWVLRVTANLAVDSLRRSSRRAPVGDLSTQFEDDTVERIALSGALQALPRRQCEVAVLCYLADLPERDVASALSMRLGTVKSHAHRARQTLKTLLTAPDERGDGRG